MNLIIFEFRILEELKSSEERISNVFSVRFSGQLPTFLPCLDRFESPVQLVLLLTVFLVLDGLAIVLFAHASPFSYIKKKSCRSTFLEITSAGDQRS